MRRRNCRISSRERKSNTVKTDKPSIAEHEGNKSLCGKSETQLGDSQDEALAHCNDEPGCCCFRIAAVDGKGLGALATQDLAAGDLVLAEPPLFAFDCTDEAGIQKQFDLLPAKAQEALMSLHDAIADGGAKTLDGVLLTNSLSRSSNPAECVLSEQVSRFNHSCVPNCDWTWDDRTQQVRVYASTSIKEAEELCIHYTELREAREGRRTQLQSRYRFECNCPCCSTESAESDERRLRMRTIVTELEAEKVDGPAKGLELVGELLELYNNEGIRLKSHGKKACYFAFQFALLHGDVESAKKWIEQAYQNSVWCHGAEHDQTKRLVRYVIDPESHPANRRSLFRGCIKLLLTVGVLIMTVKLSINGLSFLGLDYEI